MDREVAMYVHGVSPEGSTGTHAASYQKLHNGIRKEVGTGYPESFVGVEWGWNVDNVQFPKGHQALAEAERQLGSRALTAVKAASDASLNPLRIAIDKARPFYIYGLGDMFYYVSKDGQQSVRYAMCEQLLAYLRGRNLLEDPGGFPFSLTIVAHSAGSVAAMDLLFYLFQRIKPDHEFLKSCETTSEVSTRNALTDLRELAQQGKFRIRRFVTFGSPITPLAFRKDAVVELLAAGKKLDPRDYGLAERGSGFEGDLTGPRWINLWDKDDFISWPVEPLFMNPKDYKTVADVYVDVSDFVTEAHGSYWQHPAVYRAIAEAW